MSRRSSLRPLALASAALISCALAPAAHADEPAPTPTSDTARSADGAVSNAASNGSKSGDPVQSSLDPARKSEVEPTRSAAPPKRTTFAVDPIADGAMIGVALGFAALLDRVNSTGEITPQQISKTFDPSHLLGIDHAAVVQNVDPNASLASNVGLFASAAFAVLDPVLTGLREKNVQAGITDATMYAESFAITFAMTNMVKLAVRRPRPIAYIEAERHKNDPNYSNTNTDSSLSFFSGHASTVAALGATASYLAFARSPRSARPWITLAVSLGLSTFVSIERVRAGAHFPTDVIAGSIAGAGVGIVVPHLHRNEDVGQRRVWVGFSPAEVGEGGRAMVTGIF
ncbi:phosphatase PAP2 family protein [bacterium]|nr:MAG: phosphatase PAP2 family protein [bacterium]